MCDRRLWDREICETDGGVYAPNSRLERKEVWWELGSVRGLSTGPWVVVGDFNTIRFPSKKTKIKP